MVNFYEILEVSEKASKEVIDKAYRVLAKRYHPDMQSNLDKTASEEKMKQINEAYETLQNEEKRKEYDIQLENQRNLEKIKEEQRIASSYNNKNKDIQKENRESLNDNYRQEDEISDQKYEEELNRAYKQAYNQYWRSRGYKVKEPWTWEKVLKLLEALGILVIIIVIIWFFPPTNKLLMEIYNGNTIIKTLVDIIIGLIKGVFLGMVQFFSQLGK